MTEAARYSETLVNFYQTTRRYNPEDSHLRTHRRENLKPKTLYIFKFSRKWPSNTETETRRLLQYRLLEN
jgi:hypothetical protein